MLEIRTLDEVRASRVTITIDVAPSTDPGTLGRLAGQEDRITDLEAEADRYRRELGKVNEVWEERVRNLESEVSDLQAENLKLDGRVRGYDQDRHTERDRADKAVRRIINAREALLAEAVAQARRMDHSGTGRTMAQAIESALAALDAA